MRRFLMILLLLTVLPAFADGIEKGRIVKMLPLLLDLKGHDAISPSLYDRDAYQAYLRQHTNEISGIRFDFLWQVENPAAAKYKLRIELRGIGAGGKPTRTMLEQEAQPPLLRRWNSLTVGSADYKNFGELVAWRATLWRGDQLLSEQKSFLW
ncbi:MAG: hypothetical protein ABSD57_02280 [Verrucomicrobiota bacterium]|jgi:hypothetical protein